MRVAALSRKIRRGNRLKLLAFSLLPLFLLFGLAEGVLRFVFPSFDYVVVMGRQEETLAIWSDPSVWSRVGDRRRIVLVPNPSNDVNEHGYRGPVVPVERDESTLRILCIGDSTTYGVGVESEETYSAQLRKILEDQGCEAEVINGGVPSYTSAQGLAALERAWRDFRPDLILTYFGNNDTSRVMTRPDREMAVLSDSASCMGALLGRSRVYLAMQALYLQMRKPSELVPRLSPQEYEANLLRIEERGKRFGARAWHIRPILPDGNGFWEGGYPAGVSFLSLKEPFVASKKPAGELFVDGCHPSRQGHRILAEHLYRHLRDDGFLAPCISH